MEDPAERESAGLDFRLEGKVAWVTGASRGLGRAIAIALAAAGAQVALMARSERELVEVSSTIENAGGEALVVPGSVASLDAVRRASSRVVDRWGRLDVLVNNAGISPVLSRSEELDEATWRTVIEVNLTGTFLCSREAGRRMLESGGGSIINISSVHGRVASERLAAYAASKGGVEMLTRVLAAEWASRSVRVNAVAPGYLETAMTAGLRANDTWRDRLLDRTPVRRFGSTDDVVPAVVYLASDRSTYVTGSTLSVDGGWTAM